MQHPSNIPVRDVRRSTGLLKSKKSAQQGLTLVELMVALVLGLLVVLTAAAAFLASKQLFTADSEAQVLQATA